MTPQEKDQLLALLLDARHWCQSVEARSADGEAVTYSDPQATAWDLTGAVCRLFGWHRACELFIQIDRRLRPRAIGGLAGPGVAITAMVGLQRWNDDPQRSHPELVAVLEGLPVSKRPAQDSQAVVDDEPLVPARVSTRGLRHPAPSADGSNA